MNDTPCTGPDIGTETGVTYRDAGVDIDAKMSAIEEVKARAAQTLGDTAGPIGHFGGTYRLPGAPGQILVASADGVGTKLRLAFALGGDAHARMGEDIVNHCANDILALGARPLFFLDYFATGRLAPEVVTGVVGGIADACAVNGIALLGGETAEMPGMYADGEYDLAGFTVGAVQEHAIVDGSAIEPDDLVIGLPSTGLHTNGYSLARRIIGMNGDPEHDREVLAKQLPGASKDETLGEALLAPHRSYVREVTPLLEDGLVRGMAHVTGGGLLDNLPRTLPEDCIARLDPTVWETPEILDFLVNRGQISVAERYRVFNMGVGFVLVVSPDHVDEMLARLPEGRPIGMIISRVTSDESAVQGLSC
ncbi:MAG TPA: phosphoribosylformylglycinamidine cyclo-ligase [Thermomicrobiales bacterium]|nr:phosphoribosylformylglycinamidine cyclo-ligase [Thermomicrobiales bacterium]